MGDIIRGRARGGGRIYVRPPMPTIEQEHAMQYFSRPIRIDEQSPEYVKDQIREQIRMNQRIKYLSVILRW